MQETALNKLDVLTVHEVKALKDRSLSLSLKGSKMENHRRLWNDLVCTKNTKRSTVLGKL